MSEPVLDNSDVPVDPAPALWKRLAAELVGTALLVAAVLGGALFFGDGLVVALGVGLAVLAGAYAFGHLSGGHFNPAVTLGAAIAGRFEWKDVVPYIVAQIIGGLIASSIFAGLLADGPSGAFDSITANGFASNGFGEHSPNGFGLIAVIGV